MADKLVLVTGAGGFIGSHQVEEMVKSGYKVRATDIALTNPYVTENFFKEHDVEFVKSDLLDRSSLEKVMEGVQIVFHPAALFSYSANWKPMYKVNVTGTENLCEAALKAGVEKFVHFSTCEVYGRASQVPATENSPKRPTHTYGRTKLMGEEKALEYYRLFKLPVVVLRPTAVFGPRSLYGAIYPFFFVAKGLMPFLINDGDNLMSLVHAKDVVGAAAFLAENGVNGEIYNISSPQPITMETMMKVACKTLGVWEPKIHVPLPRFLVYYCAWWIENASKLVGLKPLFEKDTVRVLFEDNVFDNSKIEELGYQMRYPDFAEALPKILNWYQQVGLM